ncbi:MAG: YqgE/AlgH family protein [Planctomycetota bacterium]|nr:YqgE/AlgH family protein [Planctomycetota bacterium]MDG1984090.1 YqgE/AlgH family protein [Planctomycetota bacterium]
MSDLRAGPGTMLLSAPALLDPNFMHTVVLMCQHDEEGAFGLVVNRAGEARVGDLFPDHPELRNLELKVRDGGPVARDTLQVIHRFTADVAGSTGGLSVGDGIRIGADLESLVQKPAASAALATHARFVIGYAGWSAGQLEVEIKTGSWLPLATSADLVFSEDGDEAIWRAAMGRLGGGGASLAHLPPDPTWN